MLRACMHAWHACISIYCHMLMVPAIHCQYLWFMHRKVIYCNLCRQDDNSEVGFAYSIYSVRSHTASDSSKKIYLRNIDNKEVMFLAKTAEILTSSLSIFLSCRVKNTITGEKYGSNRLHIVIFELILNLEVIQRPLSPFREAKSCLLAI